MALTDLGKAVAAGKTIPAAKEGHQWEFLKAVAAELVFAWTDAEGPGPVRDALERVMCNVGLDRDEQGAWSLATPGGGRLWIR